MFSHLNHYFLKQLFYFSWCVILVAFGSVLQNIHRQVTYLMVLTLLLFPVAAVAPRPLLFHLLKSRRKGIGRLLLLLNLPPFKIYFWKIWNIILTIVKIVIQIVFHLGLSVINVLLYLLFPLFIFVSMYLDLVVYFGESFERKLQRWWFFTLKYFITYHIRTGVIMEQWLS